MSKTRFQVYSDLHLEFYKSFPLIEPMADYLILAGDIGNFSNDNMIGFFDYVNNNWKKIFYVLGNHEYYSSSNHFEKTKKKYIDIINQYDNIILLDKDEYILDDIIILGCTMWTFNENMIEKFINDFKKIKYFDSKNNRRYKIDYKFINNLHNDEKEWLFNKLDEYNGKKIIVITHFPMILENTSSPKYKNETALIKNYFANNFCEILMNYNDITFISGHTHFSYDFILDGNRHISNQMGYISEKYEGFNQYKTIYV